MKLKFLIKTFGHGDMNPKNIFYGFYLNGKMLHIFMNKEYTYKKL